MAKYLAQSGGGITEVLTPTTSAGAADSGKIVGLDASGRFDNSVMPIGIGADTAQAQASEALAAGDYVNVWNSGGAFRVRKADASASGKEAHGFVMTNVVSGAAATVYKEGSNTAVTGQTPGPVYLSAATPGAGTATPPSTSGQVVQRIGVAYSATLVDWAPQIAVTLA